MVRVFSVSPRVVKVLSRAQRQDWAVLAVLRSSLAALVFSADSNQANKRKQVQHIRSLGALLRQAVQVLAKVSLVRPRLSHSRLN